MVIFYTGGTTTDVCSAIGIAETEDENFLIYPNPANEFIEISIGGESEIQITDVTGKTILNRCKFRGGRIDIGEFANGLYFLTAKQNHERVLTRTIVISK